MFCFGNPPSSLLRRTGGACGKNMEIQIERKKSKKAGCGPRDFIVDCLLEQNDCCHMYCA
jgi:hypothetical protein